MRNNRFLPAFVFLILLAGCARPEKLRAPWDNSPPAPNGPAPEVTIVQIRGNSGDIAIDFQLTPVEPLSCEVALSYTGGCAGAGWRPADTGGATRNLAPGNHSLVWHSWDQEAGCSGTVQLRLETTLGVQVESDAFALDNTGAGQDGFVELPPFNQQGVQPDEYPVYERALTALLASPYVDFVATRTVGGYEVHAARGSVLFHRDQDYQGYHFTVDSVDGVNPLGTQDPQAFPTYAAELAAGQNPNNVSLPQDGYPANDPRLSFIEPENDSYPFAYQRLAAYFDNPNAANIMINWKGYAHADTSLGYQSSLNIVQSRTPLILWGAGVQPGAIVGAYQDIDIAPTVAALLDLKKTYGVDKRGIYSHDVYLTWQDGDVIAEALNGKRSERVFVLVIDGLSFTEVLRQANAGGATKIPNIVRLMNEGASAEYGLTAGYPSVSMVNKNTIGSGMYGGHHGVIDNQYYDRATEKTLTPVNDLLFMGKYFTPLGPGETIHDTIHRSLGDWNSRHGTGAITAALFDPCMAGADKADLELLDRTHQSPFPPLFQKKYPEGVAGPDLSSGDIDIFGNQILEWSGMVELWDLLFNGVTPPPTYVQFDFLVTDTAGHLQGPHGDVMEDVLPHIDQNIGLILSWLEQLNLDQTTTIVLTSDHGMELGDPSRSGSPTDALTTANIDFESGTDLAIYFRMMTAAFTPSAVPKHVYQLVRMGVTNRDNNAPIKDAAVTATDGVSTLTAVTDDSGYTEFGITAVGPVTVTIEATGFNTRQYLLPATKE
jgi:hypothetical protein